MSAINGFKPAVGAEQGFFRRPIERVVEWAFVAGATWAATSVKHYLYPPNDPLVDPTYKQLSVSYPDYFRDGDGTNPLSTTRKVKQFIVDLDAERSDYKRLAKNFETITQERDQCILNLEKGGGSVPVKKPSQAAKTNVSNKIPEKELKEFLKTFQMTHSSLLTNDEKSLLQKTFTVLESCADLRADLLSQKGSSVALDAKALEIATELVQSIKKLNNDQQVLIPGGTVDRPMIYEIRRVNGDSYQFSVFSMGGSDFITAYSQQDETNPVQLFTTGIPQKGVADQNFLKDLLLSAAKPGKDGEIETVFRNIRMQLRTKHGGVSGFRDTLHKLPLNTEPFHFISSYFAYQIPSSLYFPLQYEWMLKAKAGLKAQGTKMQLPSREIDEISKKSCDVMKEWKKQLNSQCTAPSNLSLDSYFADKLIGVEKIADVNGLTRRFIQLHEARKSEDAFKRNGSIIMSVLGLYIMLKDGLFESKSNAAIGSLAGFVGFLLAASEYNDHDLERFIHLLNGVSPDQVNIIQQRLNQVSWFRPGQLHQIEMNDLNLSKLFEHLKKTHASTHRFCGPLLDQSNVLNSCG